MQKLPLAILSPAVFLLAACTGCDSSGPPPLAMLGEAQGAQEMTDLKPAAVKFVEDFENGLEQAARDGKPLLLFFHVRQCVYCDRMLNETFADHEVARLADRFVCVRIEADRSQEVCRRFHVDAFPTVQFVSPQGTPLARLLGKVEAEPFASQMEAALRGPQTRTAYRGQPVLR